MGENIPKKRGAGRPRGSLNKRTQLRTILAEQFEDGEAGFLRVLVMQAKAGCTQTQTAIINRLYPVLKPQSETITLPPSKRLTGTSAEMASQIITLVSEGTVSPSTAGELLQSVSAMVSIQTGDELLKRIEALEELQP